MIEKDTLEKEKMSNLTEFEKKTLVSAFKDMLDSEKDYLIWETIELSNLEARRKTFRVKFDIIKE